jgi:hypothetical protein
MKNGYCLYYYYYYYHHHCHYYCGYKVNEVSVEVIMP